MGNNGGIMKCLIVGFLFFAVTAKGGGEWGTKPAYTQAVYEEAMDYLSRGRQKDAEWLVEEACAETPDCRRLWFLRGVMQRSRPDWTPAEESFRKAYIKEDDDTFISLAVLTVASMDRNTRVEGGFQTLEELIRKHPDEVLLRWLYGIEARFYGRHIAEADAQFRHLFKTWKIGPVMAHQAYAKLLTADLDQPKEALEHRLLAVELEPEPWSYQGLANTYKTLHRYRKADQVYEKLLEMNPYNALYWIQWGNCRFYMEDYEGALEKYAKADLLNPTDISALIFQGRCLEKAGRPAEGFRKYEEAQKRNPAHPQIKAYIAHARLYGFGTPPDIESALTVCRVSDAPALDQLRELVRLADRSKNPLAPEKSAVLLKRLKSQAADGSADAGYNLGMIYRYGIGVPADETAAMEWFRRAAALGHEIAQREINPPE